MTGQPDKIHINHPELMTWRQRYGGAFVTGLMWALYTYLWAPLFSLVAWLLGFEFAYAVMVRSGGLEALKSVMFWYALMVLGINVVIIGWSLLNRQRYASRNRRQGVDVVDLDAVAEWFELDKAQLAAMRTSRIAKLSHDESGRIDDIELVDVGESTRVRGTYDAA